MKGKEILSILSAVLISVSLSAAAVKAFDETDDIPDENIYTEEITTEQEENTETTAVTVISTAFTEITEPETTAIVTESTISKPKYTSELTTTRIINTGSKPAYTITKITAPETDPVNNLLIPSCGNELTMTQGEYLSFRFENASADPDIGFYKGQLPDSGSGIVDSMQYPHDGHYSNDDNITLYALISGETALYYEDAEGKNCVIYITVKEKPVTTAVAAESTISMPKYTSKFTTTGIINTGSGTVCTTIYNKPKLHGDVNGDNKVNVADLVYMQKLINKDMIYTNAADMNNDGTINVFDIVLLRRTILES